MIKKLPKNIVNILAAGEVVERPYSVVKELVENAIDADADEIIVEIQNWWKTLVKVKDNGKWISKQDLPLTIEEYATSKISKVEDIYSLHSFWFRWEALSTISEVSKFKIISRKDGDWLGTDRDWWLGWKLEKVGEEVKIEPVSVNFPHWTEVYVQDLFYNVPVRKKFLKSDQTEFKYIQDLFINFAIKYENISFKLFHNWKLVKDFPKASSLLERIKQIYPKDWEQNYLFLQHTDGIYTLNWVIWKSILKFNSSMIKIFVNGRAVKDRVIQRAVMQAYSRWLEPWMYPFAIIFLDIKPDLVDVNVHPRKEEVKFIDPNSVFQLVKAEISKLIEWWNLNYQESLDKKTNYVNFNKIKKDDRWFVRWFSDDKKIDWEKVKEIQSKKLDLEYNQNIFVQENSLEPQSDIQIIWQLFDSYILFSKWDDFYIVDQHAVAERIIFEKMRKEYNKGDITLLSIPLTFEITNKIDEKLEKLKEIWFDIDYFWEKKVIVYAVPKVLEKYNVDISALINSLLYSNNEDISINQMLEQVLATKSCKAAIKANHKLSALEMKQLIEDGIKNIDWFFVCQHWRPSVVKLTKQDIDSFFDRK